MSINVRNYAGSRYANDPKGGTLDAPDLAVRRAMMKRESGQALTDKDLNRLASRMSVEKETKRSGGAVRQPITPKRVTPFEQGQKDRQADEGYASGYEGKAKLAPAARRAPPAAPAANLAPAAPRTSAGPMALGGFSSTMRPNHKPASGPTTPPAPAASTATSTEAPTGPAPEPRKLVPVQRLTTPAAAAVGAGPGNTFVGGGGNYMAGFGTKNSAQEFADFAARTTDEESEDEPEAVAGTATPRKKKQVSALSRRTF